MTNSALLLMNKTFNSPDWSPFGSGGIKRGPDILGI